MAARQHRKRHVFITSAAVLVSLLVSAGLSGCGGTSTTATHSSAPRATSDATAVRTYPDERADAALCKTYNADISSGDTYDAGTALEQAGGSVSPKLAQDIQAVVNGGTVQQDLRAQVKVAMDCALVNVGVSPGS